MLDAFTDYPIECYGDVAGKPAPIRKATILTYDRNKYCDVLVYQVDKDGDLRGTVVNFKQFYLYKTVTMKPHYDARIQFTDEELETLPWTEVSYPNTMTTEEEILELAENFFEIGGIRDDGSPCEFYGTKEQLVSFARLIDSRGYNLGYDNGVFDAKEGIFGDW